jgi:hypothetical protein
VSGRGVATRARVTRTVDGTFGADETAEVGAKLAVLGTPSAIPASAPTPPSDSAPTPTAPALSYDHRLVDGADAARCPMTVTGTLEAAAFEGYPFPDAAG